MPLSITMYVTKSGFSANATQHISSVKALNTLTSPSATVNTVHDIRPPTMNSKFQALRKAITCLSIQKGPCLYMLPSILAFQCAVLHSRLLHRLHKVKNLPHTHLSSSASQSIMPCHLSFKRMHPCIYFPHLINIYECFIPVLTHIHYN